MLRNTPNTESLIVEYGFLDSKSGDDVNLLKNEWQKLAEATVKALADYIGVSYNTDVGYYYTVQKGDTIFMGNNEYRLNGASYCTFYLC